MLTPSPLRSKRQARKVESSKSINSAVPSQNPDEDDESKDVGKAKFLMVLVGVGYLFPFSALTQPVDYWKMLFPDFNIEFQITSVYMYVNLVMLGLLVFFGGVPSFTKRIVGGFIGQLLVLIFVPTSYFFITSENVNKIAILAATAVAAVVTAFLDSSVIALASQYPLRVQEAFQLGVGVSTLIGSIYRCFTKAVFPPDDIVTSSLLYFYSGAATIAACIGAYFVLISLPLSKACLKKAEIEEKELLSSISLVADTESSTLLPKKKQSPSSSNNMKVLRKIWFNELMVSLLFTSTLALWPPLVTEIKSFNFPSLNDSGWWSLLLLLIFSFLDCVGRLCVRFRCGLNPSNIWIPVLARFIFFPLIICSVKGIFFTNDLWSIFFISTLGFSNGYVGTLSIILVNDCITPEEQAIAGSFTSFFLNTGLVLGASAGLVMEAIVG